MTKSKVPSPVLKNGKATGLDLIPAEIETLVTSIDPSFRDSL